MDVSDEDTGVRDGSVLVAVAGENAKRGNGFIRGSLSTAVGGSVIGGKEVGVYIAMRARGVGRPEGGEFSTGWIGENAGNLVLKVELEVEETVVSNDCRDKPRGFIFSVCSVSKDIEDEDIFGRTTVDEFGLFSDGWETTADLVACLGNECAIGVEVAIAACRLDGSGFAISGVSGTSTKSCTLSSSNPSSRCPP